MIQSSYYFTRKLCTEMLHAQVICFHFGKFTFQLEDVLATEIKEDLQLSNVEDKLTKRIKSSFVEAITNIRTHSKIGASKELQGLSYGVISVIQKESEVIIISGNVIDPSEEESIKAKIDSINAMTKDELISAYKTQQKTGEISAKGGAGLGLMTMARDSDKDILYYFDETPDGHKMFLTEVTFKCELPEQ